MIKVFHAVLNKVEYRSNDKRALCDTCCFYPNCASFGINEFTHNGMMICISHFSVWKRTGNVTK
jgi:hypothetical protein